VPCSIYTRSMSKVTVTSPRRLIVTMHSPSSSARIIYCVQCIFVCAWSGFCPFGRATPCALGRSRNTLDTYRYRGYRPFIYKDRRTRHRHHTPSPHIPSYTPTTGWSLQIRCRQRKKKSPNTKWLLSSIWWVALTTQYHYTISQRICYYLVRLIDY